ncbi:MAG: GNAT family N-acetyltransferase, partial [Erythrobacter sp.]|nr:GNAT family N-acetyltransferase [Erythrobacter sp.]
KICLIAACLIVLPVISFAQDLNADIEQDYGVYLADLFVIAPHRRRGIGRALIAAVARQCRAEGGRWMFWSVLKRNRGARRFYRTIAPELKDIVVCAAFGEGFDSLAGEGE